MQPGRARTSGLGVPLLQLARWVGLVTPVCPTLGVWFVAPCPSATLGACACGVSWPTLRLLTSAHALCVPCAVLATTWPLFTGARAVCSMCVLLVTSSGTPPTPSFFVSCPRLFVRGLYLFFFFCVSSFVVFFLFEKKLFYKAEKGAQAWATGAAVKQ